MIRPSTTCPYGFKHFAHFGDGGDWGTLLLDFLVTDAVTDIYRAHGLERVWQG